MTSSARLARGLERLWYQDSRLAWPLVPLSCLFAVAVALRRRAYARGWLRTVRVGVPVIVVGNLTVGGTGKTPLVAWLARRLQAAGYRPGIVSRGYGAWPRQEPLQVTPDTVAAEAGDEPLLLARRAGVPVCIGRDRVRAARMLAEAGANVIVADDGLQHYALARDLEIVVIDGHRRFGNGRLLPAGPLREPRSRLAEAGLVVVNGGEPRAGEAGFRLVPAAAVALNGSGQRALSAFAGQKAWAVAGIGHPARFCQLLREQGIEPLAVAVPDHGRVDLRALRRQGDWPILMTEKDAVKYPDCSDEQAWYLPVDVTMSRESEEMIMARVRAVLPPAGGVARGGG